MDNSGGLPPADDDSHSLPWPLSIRRVFINVILLFAALLALIVAVSSSEQVWMRVFGAMAIFVVMLLALLDNLLETARKAQVWHKLAHRTGLLCRVTGSVFTGYSVEVLGKYRQRAIHLSTFKQGKSQVPSTRIELRVNNQAKAKLRLRGPFKPSQTQTSIGVNELFAATDARQFGSNQRYFIRSRPIHLVTNLLNEPAIKADLAKIESLVNIELESDRLNFDTLGILGDAAYLHLLIDTLSNIAEVIEHGSYIRLSTLVHNSHPNSDS
jgi:hypothetical protein